jgi:hypothetical protein
MNLKPAIKTVNSLTIGKFGQHHDDINLPGQRGFVTGAGEFMPRSKATAWVKANQPEVYEKLKDRGALHTTEYYGALKEFQTDDSEQGKAPQKAEMTDFSKLKCVVIDYGYFMNLARRLSEADGFGEVVYTPPWHSYNPTPDRSSVGMGIQGVTHGEDWAPHLLDADLIIFPDVGDFALQKLFREMKASKTIKARIFGMGDAENLELKRLFFKEKLEKLGLFQPEWGVVYGIDALREKLKKDEDLWIKIDSRYRGIKETWFHSSYKSSKTTVDSLAATLGCLRDTFMFIWEKPYGKVEGGSDYWTSAGEYLPVGWRGFEGKNEWYICKAERLENMPAPAKLVHDMIAPFYKKVGASGKASDEVRTDEHGKGYWLDATMRFGDPPFGVELRGWKNLPQMIWACAGGEMVEPVPVKPYACMIVLTSDAAADEPCPVDFESEDDEKHISLRRLHIAEDGQRYCVPLDHDNIIGSAVGFGNSVKEAVEEALYYANRVRCRELSYKENVMDAITKTLKTAESCGWGKF